MIVASAALGFILSLVFMEIATNQRPALIDLGSITILAGLAIWGVGIGLMLAITGRSRHPSAASSWLRLWAWFVLIVGLLFSVGLPIFIAGCALTILAGAHDATIDDVVITTALVIGGIGEVVGIAAIVSAIVWGRRKTIADVAHVFS